MVRLREIPRTATFAWSPGAATPLIATGTRAGAVDADFSNETCLELWDLGLGRQDASADLYPVGKISTDSGYVRERERDRERDDGSCAVVLTRVFCCLVSMTWRGPNPRIARRGV